MISPNEDEFNKILPECDVLLGGLRGDRLSRAKNLKWQQTSAAGMETELFPELVNSNVVVTNMARMFAPALGETATSGCFCP
jgi:hypothetical protein